MIASPLSEIDWTIEPHQHWVITGTNGAGKSALAAALAGVGKIEAGTVQGLPTMSVWSLSKRKPNSLPKS
ncbi:hypothetical protein HSBAA_51820 [Vreelandella sulfidaeris]|uniref:ABC transporter domain-containing protein n=1 Tax=Vreelandella sulfidaeris TaxID=115553 RepID=A0A455UCC0_9GAMM|nr:hypothetical protein HSBAA_51820 [Halomonas sulfidaeris]